MGYPLIALIVAVGLALHHVVATDASPRSKLVVMVIVVASLILWLFFPRHGLVATLLQVGAAVYMLIFLRTRYGA